MKLLLSFLLLLAVTTGFSQNISNFTLTDAVSGKAVSLSDYASSPGVVIIFSSNTCPYDGYYTNRIKKLAQTYAAKVPVILINSNPGNDEAPAAMKAYASKAGLALPYLSDPDQQAMLSLKATKSPEAVLLKSSGGSFTVFYRGAIDDNAQVESDVHSQYLKNAIDALLSGRTLEKKEVRPVGCTLKRK